MAMVVVKSTRATQNDPLVGAERFPAIIATSTITMHDLVSFVHRDAITRPRVLLTNEALAYRWLHLFLLSQ